jgi:hypothetical protein
MIRPLRHRRIIRPLHQVNRRRALHLRWIVLLPRQVSRRRVRLLRRVVSRRQALHHRRIVLPPRQVNRHQALHRRRIVLLRAVSRRPALPLRAHRLRAVPRRLVIATAMRVRFRLRRVRSRHAKWQPLPPRLPLIKSNSQ